MYKQKLPARRGGRWGAFIAQVISILSEGSSTNSELSRLFKLTGAAFYRRIYPSLGYRISYEITATDWFINDRGEKDKIYRLVRSEPAKRKAKVNVCKTVKAILHNNSEHQKRFTKLAKERARLIRAGIYNEEAERELCKKHS